MKTLLRDELTELLSEYAQKKRVAAAPIAAPASTARGFDWFDWNNACNSVPEEQTPRARKERAVLRIAMYYPWGQTEVQRLLDRSAAETVSDLSGAALDRLFDHMRALEDSAQSGCEMPEVPPAV
jgi:hypothetical protein